MYVPCRIISFFFIQEYMLVNTQLQELFTGFIAPPSTLHLLISLPNLRERHPKVILKFVNKLCLIISWLQKHIRHVHWSYKYLVYTSSPAQNDYVHAAMSAVTIFQYLRTDSFPCFHQHLQLTHTDQPQCHFLRVSYNHKAKCLLPYIYLYSL